MLPNIFPFFNSFLRGLPVNFSISYSYNFGSLLGYCLVLQFLTGIFLSSYYCANSAFDSVEYIIRDVNNGSLIRYCHSNGASFFFICVYAHIARALYYNSYIKFFTWNFGVLLIF
jgi:ubiquinol-cytochrome c reductase cytochrome b subunit